MAVRECNDILDALPEGCIANALSLTSPKDACRLSLVASTFRSAAESNAVWERFLPSDYLDIISRAVDGPDSLLARFRTKKELYLYLCDHHVLIDGGQISFSLEKWSGKKCFMLAARNLFIVWGDTPQYWQWISLPESRFSEVAELLNVCYFEIRGKIDTRLLSPETNYAAYLVFTSKSGTYGFEYQPVDTSVGISGRGNVQRTVCLGPDGAQTHRYHIVPRRRGFIYRPRLHHLRDDVTAGHDIEYPKQRVDGWMEVELGECFINGEQDGELEISLMEVKGGNWKSGLIVQGIEIRPKQD